MIKPEPNSILIMLNRFCNDYLYFVIDFDFVISEKRWQKGPTLQGNLGTASALPGGKLKHSY